MNTLREALIGIVWILAGLLVMVLVVVGIDAMLPPKEQRVGPTEADFRAACAAVKGNAIWNGRHWECLK